MKLLIHCFLLLLSHQLVASEIQVQKFVHPFEYVTQPQLDQLAATLSIKYKFISNLTKNCPDSRGQKVNACFSAEITLTSLENIDIEDWSIHFSQVYPTYASSSEQLNLAHINGDIHIITPKNNMTGFKKNHTKTVRLWVESTLISESELMPNYWISSGHLTPVVIASTRTMIDSETGLEIQPYVVPFDNLPLQSKASTSDINAVATASWLFNDNQKLAVNATTPQPIQHHIIPTPHRMSIDNKGRQLDLSVGINVNLMGATLPKINAALQRLATLGIRQSSDGVNVNITVTTTLNAKLGSYQLFISTDDIKITAADASGAFYALQSLAALKKLGSPFIPVMEVIDEPRYQYRGQHIDVARNFLPKKFVLRLIEQMGAYKLNKLHLHLAEDEGWRLEIPSLPELTSVGAKRCMAMNDTHCLQPQLGGAGASLRDGFYTVADYQEILSVASKHHVQVIPSLDMPGHSRAAVKAMEARYDYYMKREDPVAAKRYLLTDFEDKTRYRSIQHYNDNTLNICMESTYTFINRVLTDLQHMHQQAGHPLTMYHIGADETAGAWTDSPACKERFEQPRVNIRNSKHLGAQFVERVANMIADKGISVGGWNDGLSETDPKHMPSSVYSYIWGTFPDGAHRQTSEQASRDWNIILSIPDLTYFDFPYEIDPKERGYNWASRRVNSRNIFNFMPDNIPLHAEFRVDKFGNNFESDDRVQRDQYSRITHKPLPTGFKITGIQGQLWSETIRSTAQAEYMLYPRLIVLAERAWHTASWEVPYNEDGALYSKSTNIFTDALKKSRDQQWSSFSQSLAKKELPKLELVGIPYRLPTVGAQIIEGKLHANVILNGLNIEYRQHGGIWMPYSEPVAVKGDVYVRARTFDGIRAGRKLLVN